MAGEPKTEMEKTLRALLLVSLDSLKQKPQIAILDKAGFGQSRNRRGYRVYAEGGQREAR